MPTRRTVQPGLAETVDGLGAATYQVGPRVKELPSELRPRERLMQRGASDLSDAELLAIVLRTGSARASVNWLSNQVLAHHGGLAGVDRASLEELTGNYGLGAAKATEIKAALELGKRLVSLHAEHRARMGSPRDVFNMLRGELSTLEHEEVHVVHLNTKNEILGARRLYQGSLNSTSIRLAELFREAIRAGVANIILVHNHPSGDTTPSPEDVAVTRDASRAGDLLEISLLDHVIVGRGDDNFVSLKERGLGFSANASLARAR